MLNKSMKHIILHAIPKGKIYKSKYIIKRTRVSHTSIINRVKYLQRIVSGGIR